MSTHSKPIASSSMPLTNRFNYSHPRIITSIAIFQRLQVPKMAQRRQESTSTNSSPSTSPAAKQPPRPNVYRQFGRPFFKVFLGAMLTYQVLYWSWEKMRLDEVKADKRAEIKALEQQVEEYRLSKGK